MREQIERGILVVVSEGFAEPLAEPVFESRHQTVSWSTQRCRIRSWAGTRYKKTQLHFWEEIDLVFEGQSQVSTVGFDGVLRSGSPWGSCA